MTKLTTERLETIATWREKYGNGANVMIPAEEAELMARRILAYDQAAKNPVASCWSKGGILQRDQFIRYDVSSFPDGEIKLFAAPVLPKQPEQCEVSKKRLEVIGYGSVPASISEQRSMARALLSAQPVSEPYKLKDAVADIRNSGVEIDADKIKAERDALNSPVIPDGSADTKRLNWLDAQNARLNEYFGTSYGWKFDVNLQRSAMILNDCNFPVMTVRQAIDEAMLAAAPAQEQK